MNTDLLTETQLIYQTRARGCSKMTHAKVERWHKKDVIPRPVIIEHLGYPKGNRSLYAPQAVDQVVAAYHLLEHTRNFDVVRFQLWQAGFPIPPAVLRNTIRQLAPPLKWKIPRGDERKYQAAVKRRDALLHKTSRRLAPALFKLFGKNLQRLESLVETQMYLLHGMQVTFGPSRDPKEPSLTDIYAQGTGLKDMQFIPSDLTADLQRMADQELLSLSRMNAALERATDEDLRRVSARAEVFPLVFEWLDLMETLPKLFRSLPLHSKPDPHLQAVILVFTLRLEEEGYAENIDGLIEALRVQVPRMRAWQMIYPDLQLEFSDLAQELGSPAAVWREVRRLPASEHEAFFARKQERLSALYQQHKEQLDAFWQRYPEVTTLYESEEISALRQPEQEPA